MKRIPIMRLCCLSLMVTLIGLSAGFQTLDNTKPRLSFAAGAIGMFDFDPELHDKHFLDIDQTLKPEIHLVMDSNAESFPNVTNPIMVPSKYGNNALRLYASNKTLQLPMRLEPPNLNRELKDSTNEVAIKLSAEEIFLCQNGFHWETSEWFRGKPLSPAYTTKGEIADSVTIWAELRGFDGIFYRSAPDIISLTKIKPQLERERGRLSKAPEQKSPYAQ